MEEAIDQIKVNNYVTFSKVPHPLKNAFLTMNIRFPLFIE